MNVYQVVTTLGYGDAVGNDIIALAEGLKQAGYQTKVFAEAVDTRVKIPDVEKLEKMPKMEPEDVILYHLATGADLNRRIAEYPCKKILCYHNITPPHFFMPYSEQAAANCRKGLSEVAFLSDKVDYCLLDSEYNKNDLKRLGYRCKMDVLPILIRFEDYEKPADEETVKRLKDGYENILFVGRIAPNKKHEDVIAAFALYKKYYNPKARLILAGSYGGMEKYYQCLQAYVEKIEVEDVVFTGHIRFEELLAYYQCADMFLCMSEHEGFCVPLVEAMYFDTPVLAYDSCAVGETLGGAGIVLKEKEPLETAAWMNRIHQDKRLRGMVLENQRERLKDFSRETVLAKFLEYMKIFIGE